jgi:uncharacterized protein with HEPN domain
MSKRPEREFLLDISESARRIISYTEGMDYDDFLVDLKTQDSVIRNIEIIGEAVKNLSIELRTKHNQVAWKSMAGMRDRLIHDYFGINIDIVWGVVTENIPILLRQLDDIVSRENRGAND